MFGIITSIMETHQEEVGRRIIVVVGLVRVIRFE